MTDNNTTEIVTPGVAAESKWAKRKAQAIAVLGVALTILMVLKPEIGLLVLTGMFIANMLRKTFCPKPTKLAIDAEGNVHTVEDSTALEQVLGAAQANAPIVHQVHDLAQDGVIEAAAKAAAGHLAEEAQRVVRDAQNEAKDFMHKAKNGG